MSKNYSNNIYTNEYYLAQYILRTVFLKKKYCYMILTLDECNMLKERMPTIQIVALNSNTQLYEIYAD